MGSAGRSDRGGKLVLVGTPLGNREDLSPRARRALLEADLLLCEDTRSPARLLAPLAEDEQLPERLSCFVANERSRVDRLCAALEGGATVGYVSEAGLPVWSDPGRELVAAAVAGGYEVDVIPGPTAASCALALSGFAAEGAVFLGFLPRSGPPRAAALAELAAARGPALIYESGKRTAALLADLAEVLGPAAWARAAVVVREFSKLHQQVLRGSVAELAADIGDPLRGEVTVVVDGDHDPSPREDPAQQAARAVLELLLDAKLKPRARAKALAAHTGLDAREIYERLHARPSECPSE